MTRELRKRKSPATEPEKDQAPVTKPTKKSKPAEKKPVSPKKQEPAAPASPAKPESDDKKPKSKGLNIGDKIPDVTVTDETGKEVKLRDLTKDGPIVIFTYPRANTPGCTQQACEFMAQHDLFVKHGYRVFGLAANNTTPQANWKKKHGFPYTLLCDPSFVAVKAFGILSPNKSAIRSYFVFDKSGVFVDGVVQIGSKPSVAAALEYVKTHGKK